MTHRCIIILLFVFAWSNGVDSFFSRLDRFAHASVQDRLLNLSNSGSSHCFLHEDIVDGGGILLKLGPSEVHYGNVSQVNIFETLIKKTCRFTTGIVGSNETIKSHVGRILSRVKRHQIVAVGSEEPSLPHNFPNNRVVVWAKQEKDTVKIHRWCPTVGLPRPVAGAALVSIWSKNAEFGRKNPFACPSPLLGQTVTASVAPNIPDAYNTAEFRRKPLAGPSVRFFQLVARQFRFKPLFHFDYVGRKYDPKQRKYVSGSPKKVDDDEAQMCAGPTLPLANRMYDITSAHKMLEVRLIYRAPEEMVSLNNVALPFPGIVWMITILILIVFSIFFFASHSVYLKFDKSCVSDEKSKANFVIFTLCKITEPEPLPWFTGRAFGGRLGVSLWALFTFLMVMFYQSNLRAHMVTVTYGKSIDTLEDVLEHGKRVWIPWSAVPYTAPYLKATGRTDDVLYKVALLSERTGGFVAVARQDGTTGYPEGFQEDIWENGGLFLSTRFGAPYMRLKYTRLDYHLMQQVKENIDTLYRTFLLKKNSPATEDVAKVAARVMQTGLMQKYDTEHLSSTDVIRFFRPKANLKKLELRNLITCFVFCGAGLLLAVGVFLGREFNFKKPA